MAGPTKPVDPTNHFYNDHVARDSTFSETESAALEEMPDQVADLSRIASTILGVGILGRAMTAGDYFAAAILIALILCGVKGVLPQDKFRLIAGPALPITGPPL